MSDRPLEEIRDRWDLPARPPTRRRCPAGSTGGRSLLPLGLPLLRAEEVRRPAVGALPARVRLVPPVALGLLEGVRRRRLRRRGLRGAAGHAGAVSPRRERAEA